MSVLYPRFLKAAHFPPSNYEEMMVDKLPSKKLEFEFIHGASKKGCKGSYFHVNDENKLVYPSAACGVIYSPNDNQQVVFRRHDDDVVTIAKHPNQYLFASGQIGKDDMIYVWDSHEPEKEPIVKLDTHVHFKNGGVLALCFSNCGGDLIATVGGNDTSSILLLYNWRRNELIGSTKCLSSEIFDIQFSPDDSQIYVCGKNTLKMYNTRDLSCKSGVFGSKGTLQNTHSICFNMKTSDAYVGVEDGSIYLFRDGKVIQTINAHNGNVFTLYPLYSKNDTKYNYGFVSGGKDGMVKYWKFNNQSIECYKTITINGFVKNVTHSIHDDTVYASKANGDLFKIQEDQAQLLLISHFGTTLKQLWGLDTFKEVPLFVTCSDDGRVIVWNVQTRKHVALLKLASSGGMELRGVSVSPNNQHVAITSKEGHLFVYEFNMETLSFSDEPTYTRRDSMEEIATLSYNHDGSLLALGSHDNYIYLYSINGNSGGEYKYIGKLVGHSSFITHLDISKCGNYLRSNSGDYEILLWDLQTRKQCNCMTSIEEIEWNSITCPLGWTVRGIWKQDFDGTDINACCVDIENSLIIAGEDTTLISLYHYPCSIIKPYGYSYIGHCSHITNVKFLNYTNQETQERTCKLLTCGGGDLTIIQWNLINNNDQLENLDIPKSSSSADLKMDSVIGGGLYKPKSPRGQSANNTQSSSALSPRSPRNGIGGQVPTSPRSPSPRLNGSASPRSTPTKSTRSSSQINNSTPTTTPSGVGGGGPKSCGVSESIPQPMVMASPISIEPPTPNLIELASFGPPPVVSNPQQSVKSESKLKIVLQYEKCKTILPIDLNNPQQVTFEHLTSITREDFDIDENQKLDLVYHDNELDCDIHIRNDRHVQTCYDSFKSSNSTTIINVFIK